MATGGTLNRFGYTGREWDPKTGLCYYRARYYDPANGRFLSEDPIRFEAGINFYVYVLNDPIDFDDPNGLKQTCTTKIMLVTAYCVKNRRTASGPFPREGTVATANTNSKKRPNPKPIPYPFGCSVTVDDASTGENWKTEYEGTIQDTGAGWDSKHHDVLPDAWIDIWKSSCKKAKQYGKRYRTVTICCDDCN